MGYANQAILIIGLLPSHLTIKELIITKFNRHKEVVTTLLYRVLSKIYLLFNLWMSCNYLLLLSKPSFRPLLY